MGVALSFVQIFDEERKALGVSDEEFHKLVKPEGRVLITKFAELMVKKTSENFAELREEWQKFYKKHFNEDVDFSNVFVPPKPLIGTWRLLIIAQNMTRNKVYARCENLFDRWRYEKNLDTAVSVNTRTAEKHYAVWVVDGVEPDVEFLDKSTHDADHDMKIGETLLERLVQELKYFSETGKHLDEKGVTFCSGSRGAVGGVPGVYWDPHDGRVCVRWYAVGCSYAGSGVRRAVSA